MATDQPTLWDTGEPLKRCTKCKRTLPLHRFGWCYKDGKRWRVGRCKKCQNRGGTEARVRRMKRDPEFKIRMHRRVQGLRRRKQIGMSQAEYEAKLASQNELCAICRQPETRKANNKKGDSTQRSKQLCADHCHATGKNRDLLCHDCNVMLGNAKDNPATLRAAADYLERHAANGG